MSTLIALLTANGYDATAAKVVATSPLGDMPSIARERITAVAQNYYMQYLAIQLGRFDFDLNRPRLKPEELQQAQDLILGKMGNDPLDNKRLADLLHLLVNDTVTRFNKERMTWGDFYLYEFRTHDGIVIRAEDMMKAMIRSNHLHYGAHADIYHHSFNGTEYKTASMHCLMMQVLMSRKLPLTGVNAFGVRVNDEDIKRVRDVASRITNMRDPHLMGFFQQHTHEHVKQKLALIFKELLGNKTDLATIYKIQAQLMHEHFDPSMYNPEWHDVLREMDTGLQWIATPYARPMQQPTAVH